MPPSCHRHDVTVVSPTCHRRAAPRYYHFRTADDGGASVKRRETRALVVPAAAMAVTLFSVKNAFDP